MGKKNNIFKRMKIIEDFKKTDKFLLFLILSLTGYGLLTIISATKSFSLSGKTTQIAATILGIIGMYIVSKLDYVILAKLWKIYVPIGYAMILLLFTTLGYAPSGTDNRVWIRIPLGGSFLSIQPPEVLKLVFILAFAYHIYVLEDEINKPINVILLIAHALVPVILINRLGDDGTMIIFIFVIAGMLFASGLDIKYIIGFVILAVIALCLVWFDVGPFGGLMSEYQRDRIRILFPGNEDPLGEEWQTNQGLTSLGMGGAFGIGLNAVNKFYFVKIENDFIFTYVGQIFGFVGAIGLIILLFMLCVRILIIGYNSYDKLGGLICVGIFSMIASQTVINIGMCLKLTPVIGITLPFFSKGGTSVLTILVGMGLVLSVHQNNKTTLFASQRKYIIR